MSSRDAKKKAEQYLRDQAKIIGKYGIRPKLSGERYKEAVSHAKRTFEVLSGSLETATIGDK